MNLSWFGSLLEPLAGQKNTRSLTEVVEVGCGSAPYAHTTMCLQGVMLPDERRNSVFLTIKGGENRLLEGKTALCLLVL